MRNTESKKALLFKITGYVIAAILIVRLFYVPDVSIARAQEGGSVEDGSEDDGFLSSLASKLYCGMRRFFGGYDAISVCTETKPLDQAAVESKENATQNNTKNVDNNFLGDTISARPEEIRSALQAGASPVFSQPSSIASGVSRQYVDGIISNLKLTLLSEIDDAKRSPISYTVTDSTNYLPLSGGTISGALTVTGATTLNGIEYNWPSADGTANQVLSTNGSGALSWSTIAAGGSGSFTQTAGLIYNSTTTDQVLLGATATTTTAKLEVSGDVAATIFTSTSTTATSTFANHISIGTDKEYRINGTGLLTRVSGTGAILLGDISGNARGTSALDVQSTRTAVTQVASGVRSTALGNRNTASGDDSTALGSNSSASGQYSVAIGRGANAFAANTVSIGQGSYAYGSHSVAIGESAYTGGVRSASLGAGSYANGTHSLTLGYYNTASDNAFAGGKDSGADADSSLALGRLNDTFGDRSTAVGYDNDTSAAGDWASAIGYQNDANGWASNAFGYKNTVSSDSSGAFGNNITNSIATSTQIGPSDAAKLTILGASGSVGFVGVGTTTPQYPLHVATTTDTDVAGFTDSNGTCTVDPTSTALVCSSDERLKKDFEAFGSTIAKIHDLNPLTYRWRNDNEDAEKQIGFVAQEVKEVFPELVSEQKSGFLALNYAGFTPILVKAIQELDIKVDMLIGTPGLITQGSAITNYLTWIGEKVVANIGEFNYTYTKEITADKLCLGDICITEDELQEILNETGVDAASHEEEHLESDIETSSSGGGSDEEETTDRPAEEGDETVETEEPVEDIEDTNVEEQENTEEETGASDSEGITEPPPAEDEPVEESAVEESEPIPAE